MLRRNFPESTVKCPFVFPAEQNSPRASADLLQSARSRQISQHHRRPAAATHAHGEPRNGDTGKPRGHGESASLVTDSSHTCSSGRSGQSFLLLRPDLKIMMMWLSLMALVSCVRCPGCETCKRKILCEMPPRQVLRATFPFEWNILSLYAQSIILSYDGEFPQFVEIVANFFMSWISYSC